MEGKKFGVHLKKLRKDKGYTVNPIWSSTKNTGRKCELEIDLKAEQRALILSSACD